MTTRPRPTTPLLMFLGLLAVFARHEYALFPVEVAYGQADALVAARWMAGEVSLTAGTLQAQWVPRILSVVPRAEAHLASWSGWTVTAVERWRALAGVLAGLTAIFLAGFSLQRNAAVGVLSVALLPISWVTGCMIGYDLLIWTGRPNVGNFGMALAALVWSVWLVGRARSRWRVVPYLLAGVLFSVHPTYALILLALFVADDGWEAWHEVGSVGGWARPLRGMAIGVVGFTLLSGMWFLRVLPAYSGARHDAVGPDWWALMYALKLHHLAPWHLWRFRWGMGGLGAGLLLFVMLLVALRGRIDRSVFRKLFVTVVVVTGLVAVSAAGVEAFRSSLVASLTLTRATFLLPLGIAVMASQVSWSAVKRPRWAGGEDAFDRGHRALLLLLPVLLVMPGPPVLKVAAVALILALDSTDTGRTKQSTLARALTWTVTLTVLAALTVGATTGGVQPAPFWLATLVLISVMALSEGTLPRTVYLAVGAALSLGALAVNEVWVSQWLSADGVLAASTIRTIRGVQVALVLLAVVFFACGGPWWARRLRGAPMDFQDSHNSGLLTVTYALLLAFTLMAHPTQLARIREAARPLSTEDMFERQGPAFMDVVRLTKWLGAGTPADAVVLLPPHFRYSTGVTGRASLIESGEFGLSVYATGLIDLELNVLDLVYAVNLRGMSTAGAIDFYHRHACAFERGYLSKGAPGMEAVRESFPYVTHVVGLRQGSTPLMWACGPFLGGRLDFPVVYENTTYLVYDVTGR